jgi:radical SAM protein with 4Fe4S-binding SPASM domain
LFTAEEEEEFAPILGRRLCLAGITGCVISAHGKIRPCPHNDQGYGNILTEPFTDIWARMSGWSQPEMLPERCQQCVANVVCEGGCRISAKMTTGLYNGEDRYMTAPIDDLDRVLPIRVTTRQQETQLGELRVNSAVRFRKETFGAVIATRDQIEYLNHWGAELFQTLQSWPMFTVERVAEHYQLPSESLIPVINRLVQREMCISNDDPRGGEIYVAPAC